MLNARSVRGAPEDSPATISRILSAHDAMPRHLVSLKDFSRAQIEILMRLAGAMERSPAAAYADICKGRVAAILWYQQSFRTRLGFETAVLRLGGGITGFSDPAHSRSEGWYAESIDDVVRFGGSVVDLVVMRHFTTGEVGRIAGISPVPVLNGGDGFGEHPSQALGDMFHLFKMRGSLDGLRMGIVGSLNWRAFRSLAVGLSKFDVELVLLPPPGKPDVPDDVAEELRRNGTSFRTVEDVAELLDGSDAVTTLGVNQSEFDKAKSAGAKAEPTPARYRITLEGVRATGRDVAVMHVGPITDEIDRNIDGTAYARYFAEARDGMWMRMAAIAVLLNGGARGDS